MGYFISISALAGSKEFILKKIINLKKKLGFDINIYRLRK